ncbi:MAG: hypothetical protein HY053_09005 [Proteobacteria bacterium]|nr:hypothetical protein [Pseudomonadota bacterium]
MSNNQRYLATFAAVAVAVVLLVFLLQSPSNSDSLGSRVNRAIDKVSEGVRDAGKELKPESQKTLGEKVGDTVEGVGKDIKGTK